MASEGTSLATAYVQIIPSAKGIKGSLQKTLGEEASAAGRSAGSTIGSTIKKAIIAAGIGAVLKESLSVAGKLQQSLGGIDTLYSAADGSKAAVKALQNYAKAAASAGISANSYMEQATSFGAALKQSLGGDTVKAAKAANMAIMDMSDNAAKMGTDMMSIQYAYQGFAKQNYTMLDNLKLGYGGTKAEMERLLADATKLTGVKYDISNLSDVYTAIHVIQENLGLTGVAAEEAKTTLTGSFGAMKASLENFLGALALGEDVQPALDDLMEKVNVFLTDNLFPMIDNILVNLPTILTSLSDILAPMMPDLIAGAAMIITALIVGLIENLPVLVGTVLSMGGQIMDALAGVDWGAIGMQILTAIKTAFEEHPGETLAAVGIFAGLILSKLGGIMTALQPIGSGIAGLIGRIGGASSTAAPAVESAGSSVGVLSQNALGLIAAGAGIFLAAAGLYLLAQAAIAIASAGPGAAFALLGLVAALAGFAFGAAALAPALAAGAIGLIAFGAAVALIGVGILLATTGMSILAGKLPIISIYGASAAVSILMISAAMVGFSAASLLMALGLAAVLLPLAGAVLALAGFAAALVLAGAGALLLMVALKSVVSSTSEISKNSTQAATSLHDMVTSVSIVQAALKGLTSKLDAAGKAFVSMFTTATPTATAAAQALAMATMGALTAQVMMSGAALNAGWMTVLTMLNATTLASLQLLTTSIQKALQDIQQMFSSTELVFNQSIRVPHFSMSGSFDAASGRVPSVDVSWYRKAYDRAYVLNGATIFGSMNGQLLGGGEGHGGEVVMGMDSMMATIREAVGLDGIGARVDALATAIENYDPQIVLDSGVLVGSIAGKMDAQLGKIAVRKGRG